METMRIGEARIPARLVLLHFQPHAFHAVGQSNLGQAAEVLLCFHQTTDKRGRIAAFDKSHEPHTRIAQNGRKSIKFMRFSLMLVHELAPIDLDLLSRSGLLALNRRVTSHRRPQRMHIFFQDADPSGVAHLL
jgi:hypothetical protein